MPDVKLSHLSSTATDASSLAGAQTLADLVRYQLSEFANRTAFTFYSDDGSKRTLTVGELDERARAVAVCVREFCEPGDRALMIYPPGLEFISAFFGCVYAGVLPVPATYPKPRRPMPRLLSIQKDCDAKIALTTSQTLETLELVRSNPEFQGLQWLPTNEVSNKMGTHWEQPEIDPDDTAFLQYTSGSTTDPKGVMVTHRNLLHNLAMIYDGFRFQNINATTGVFWLPAYHDMGLVGGILEPLYAHGHTILMPPASFLQRPLRWLKVMTEMGGNISGAPNFAYKLCVNKISAEEREQLDLSNWRVAFCGAEPICSDTLERFAEAFEPCGFSADAFYPCYGLAEATLLAAGGDGPGELTVKRVLRSALAENRVEPANGHIGREVQKLVACGRPQLDQEIVIADPQTMRRLPPNQVGEIWVRGPSIARGYWNKPEESKRTFGVRLADADIDGFLRTGDLGFVSEGELFVTGRVKDVIIIRGSNHYPQDIEQTINESHPALQSGSGAAFSVEHEGQERLVAVHEVDRQHRGTDLSTVFRDVRRAVASQHELDMHAIVLIRQASLPRTTSGKVQRNLCRQHFLGDQLNVMAQWVRNGNGNGNGKHDSNGNGSHNGNGHHHNGNGATHGDRQQATSKNRIARKIQSDALFDPSDLPLSADQLDRLSERIEDKMIGWLQDYANVPEDDLHRETPFAEMGIDSLTAVELSQELEDWLQVKITPIVAWNYPTPVTLSRYLAEQVGGVSRMAEDADETESSSGTDFEKLLAEVESMSDEEAQALLDQE